MSVVIRQAVASDKSALIRLMAVLHEFESHIEKNRADGSAAETHLDWVMGEIERNGGIILVAELSGNVAGFVGYSFEEDPGTFVRPEYRRHAMIWDLCVAEDARGQGVGRALLTAAEDAARQAGIAEIRLYVLAQNHRARRIYEEAGFRDYERLLSKRF